jgi:hypothetical protein
VAHGVIEEFRTAGKEIAADSAKIPLWQPIAANYSLTLIGECQKAIQWSEETANTWLVSGMFEGDPAAKAKASKIVLELGDHALTRSHSRHISMDKAKETGLKIVELEQDPRLQDAVLSLHHACIQTLAGTAAIKIIENHKGVASISTLLVKGHE